MEHQEAQQLLLKLLALAERMEQRDAQVIERLVQGGAALRAAAQGMEGEGQRLARDALEALRGQGREAVQAGLAEALAQCRERIAQASTEASRATGALAASAEALRRQRTLWAWAAPLALIVGSVLAVGAAAYAVASSREQVERHRIEAALLRAYNRADVTLCGDRLCANVDEGAQRHGPDGRYRPVRPRAAGAATPD